VHRETLEIDARPGRRGADAWTDLGARLRP